ncbi:hypothetical protein CHS0354_016561 [Potamilus streckersoni]|uniref:VWFA domain-containing protein n=1 Tax=Potamilus streckersoni TaxID=2493646 RepID=A0AAE0TL05_9BIVA|nr:hypothetical protein CHS0354_016561 [Potamilus streckersoni]
MGTSYFQVVKQFIRDLTQHFPIDSAETRVAMVEFDTSARLAWHLNTYSSKSDILRAISNLQYHGSGADLISGLGLVRHEVLNSNHHPAVNSVGDRPNVPNVLVVLTERLVFDEEETVIHESSMLHQIANVIVIYVGRTPNNLHSVLASRLPSDPQQMLWVDTVDNLASQIPKLLSLICG